LDVDQGGHVMECALTEWGDEEAPGILLWPGLGSIGSYFSACADALPGRAVAVDPPGFGGTPALDPCTYSGHVGLARALIEECGCHAMVGHSLGADLAVGVAADPPPGLATVVLIDGGYLDEPTRSELGMPSPHSRVEVIAWLESNSPVFPDWESAFEQVASFVGASTVSEALEVWVRGSWSETHGEIRSRTVPEQAADLLCAFWEADPPSRARAIAVPTLLVACGQPVERSASKAAAWSAFADASPNVTLHVAQAWGHNPLIQDPEGANALLAGWLKQHLC
jgi:pimeloyl-ACP methyl ester carboxylesterase